MLPCRRFALPLAGHDARLGVDVTRYVFIAEDLHLLLLVGLPTHYQAPYPMTGLAYLAHGRRVIEAMRPGICMNLFQASRQALRMSS
jgi:hypothetical protein